MKMVGVAVVAALIGGGVYVHGPINAGELYPLPAAEALERVQDVELPSRVKGLLYEASTGGRDVGNTIDRAVVPGKSVIFTFNVQGKPVGTYTVSVDPADAGNSRISTDFAMAADAEDHMKGIVLPMANQFRFVGKAMMAESIDAALDGRPYDKKVEAVARTEYAAAYPGEIMKGANDAMVKASRQLTEMKRDTATAAPPTYNYGNGPQPSFVPGKPMVTTNPR